ncbi:hypothetical protein M2175_004021 [Bradyrhizobium elkanii]|uniref:hypothetical protein n=1 Tax=Bradyrhizobium TaxID=374 RepID=UPI00216916FE|nr:MULTISPECIES: hypothetical protein [Bradyrhizobium]MCS3928990.1 hypothetical protein [Bradyrhizobium elkanii]MCS3969546.1 hypothetical protein [Bradyrhizobium japonicum]
MQRGDERRTRRQVRRASCESMANPLNYWRRFPAVAFDVTLRSSLRRTIRKIGSTLPEWKAAIAGDAGAAVGIVLRLRPPFRISARTDLAMSLLLTCAFTNAGAALVLSHALRRMQFSRAERKLLADSWLAHNKRLARRRKPRPNGEAHSRRHAS